MLSRRAVPWSLACLFAPAAGGAQEGADLWVCHEVPPYLSRTGQGYRGYAYALFQRVVKQAGLRVNLQYVPFARAVSMLQGRAAQGALVVSRTPEREAEFRWLYPVGRFRFALFTRLAAPPPASVSLAALKQVRIGSLRASASRSMLETAGVPGVVEGKDYPELLALLNRGLVDAVVAPESVLRSLDAKAGEGLRVTLMAEGHDFYAVAGPAMAQDTVQRIGSAYRRLVETGVVAQLRKAHPEASFGD